MGTRALFSLFLIWASINCARCSLPSEYSILGADLEGALSEERVVELFRIWQAQHRKVYLNQWEAEMRLFNFRRNLKYVLEKNSGRKSPTAQSVGLNRFADMSIEEFRLVYLSKVKKPTSKKWDGTQSVKRESRVNAIKSCDAPSSLDWRNYGIVTGVKNQGSCGSCWAFSATGAMEGISALVTGDLVSLSEQELLDCVTTNCGCCGGNMPNAFQWVINNGGINSEENYPYTSYNGTSSYCNTTKEETKVVSIDGYEHVDKSDSALECAVAKQPISVGIDGSTLDFMLYTGGIYNGSCSDNPYYINHAVLIVGYGSENDEKYWIVKNSWGTIWGIEGYFYLLRDTDLEYGVCAVNALASYPTKMTKHKLPWTKIEESEMTYHPLQRKRNSFSANG